MLIGGAALPLWAYHCMSALIGLVIGSFLNVVIVRLPRDQSIIKPASRCPQCKKKVSVRDNIPLLSYLLLGGKCRHCRKPISIRYPIVELLTALLFVATEMRFGWSLAVFLRDWPFVSLLIAITFIDLEHRIIPDELSLGGLALGVVTCWLEPGGIREWVSYPLGALFGFAAFYLLAWIYQTLAKRSGLGGGDIKMLAMIGAFLGSGGVFATIFVSSVFGSLVGILWGLAKRKNNIMKLSFPYGPFLVIGALYYYLLGDLLWFQFMTPT